jgi:fructose/tagatose bisphosphate aldolase
MLISMKEMAAMAQKKGYTVGAFHALNLEQVQGVLQAAVEEQAPAIISLDEPGAIYAGLEAFYAMTHELAGQVPVPVSVLLDHVHDHDLISNALSIGYTGVLADLRSEEPDRSFAVLEQIKATCYKQGTFFEVSLPARNEQPAITADFTQMAIEKINPDSLCLSIAKNERTQPAPDLFPLLETIFSSLDTPLSIAGIGRWSRDEISKIIKLKPWKASVGTRLNIAFTRGLKSYLDSQPDRINPRSYLASARDAYTNEIKQCIRMFSS